MESNIVSAKKNPFLHREEILIELKNGSSPTIAEVTKAVGKDENLTVVKRINSKFGNQTFTADVVVYDSVESKDKVEVIPKKVRKKLLEEKKAAEEAAKKEAEEKAKAEEEAKAAEAEKPAEEAKEEAPTEKKTEESKEVKEEGEKSDGN